MRPAAPLAFSAWVYHLMLKAYPPAFRQRFAAEMAQVFQSVCADTYAESGTGGLVRMWLPMVWDWAWAALYQWWLRLSRRKVGNMDTRRFDIPDGIPPLSAAGAGLAALPFLAFGISSMVAHLEYFHER